MNSEEKICPMIKAPCVGKECSEFVPRHTYIDEYGYGYGIQDLAMDIWCWARSKKYPDHTYKGTISAHCRQDMRAAEKWDKKEFEEDWQWGIKNE